MKKNSASKVRIKEFNDHIKTELTNLGFQPGKMLIVRKNENEKIEWNRMELDLREFRRACLKAEQEDHKPISDVLKFLNLLIVYSEFHTKTCYVVYKETEKNIGYYCVRDGGIEKPWDKEHLDEVVTALDAYGFIREAKELAFKGKFSLEAAGYLAQDLLEKIFEANVDDEFKFTSYMQGRITNLIENSRKQPIQIN